MCILLLLKQVFSQQPQKLTCTPARACGCSALCGDRVKMFQRCCGPPIWVAGRSIGMLLSVVYLIVMAVNISSLVNTPGDSVDLSKFNYTSPQDCSQQGARSVKVLTVVVTASGSIIYAFGAYAAHTKLALLTGIFFRAHVCYQALYIPLTICGNGHYSKSPRDKDAGLEAACRASCMALGFIICTEFTVRIPA
mmetsp:Transcript_58494/g.154258  ORF Transcript_58494/g.154258 Transcript_58494/m.154258 type:complete len:194 (+) Transcript_58494:141-722(+)